MPEEEGVEGVGSAGWVVGQLQHVAENRSGCYCAKKKSKQNLRHKAKKKEESKRVEDGKEVQAPRRCNTLDESRVEEFE